MKGSTMLSALQRLGVVSSFNSPRASDDNPYSEAIFRIFQCRPGYPRKLFLDVEAARSCGHGFVRWYNEEHKQSGLKFLIPAQWHRGESEMFMDNRKKVYRQAK
ncbi:MAG: hypothetical protein QS721_09310 [Candidatus Endonucleobacter sp. (ex Gigantidas childressi)]|nr:hypothetical protein [Candidatus Endonucleobacter sp. (ex Gigantidas childressi)]